MLIVLQNLILIANYVNHDKLKMISMSGGGAVAAPPGGPLTALFRHYFLIFSVSHFFLRVAPQINQLTYFYQKLSGAQKL